MLTLAVVWERLMGYQKLKYGLMSIVFSVADQLWSNEMITIRLIAYFWNTTV